MNFVPFPSIEGFHNVVKSSSKYGILDDINYRGKIKIHGTNSAVRLKGGEVVAQSRNQLIDVKDDNAGFARWVESRKDYFLGLMQKDSDFTIFGEWCGPGIMKGTAINQIPNKIFAVFAVVVGSGENAMMMVDPQAIDMLLGVKPSDVHVLPWVGEAFKINFTNLSHLRDVVVKSLNAYVDEIEPCDPWVKSVFGVEGVAEGVVYYPSANENITVKQFEYFAFKAKGEKHKVVKTREAFQVDPEVAKSQEEFVNMFVTVPRLEQAVAATGGSYETKNAGAFLKWFGQDVLKESTAELEASGLTWDQVTKPVQIAARNWFLNKSKTL
jgi:hypothetical protein